MERTNKPEVKFTEPKAADLKNPGQGAEYWRERYQASKMEN